MLPSQSHLHCTCAQAFQAVKELVEAHWMFSAITPQSKTAHESVKDIISESRQVWCRYSDETVE